MSLAKTPDTTTTRTTGRRKLAGMVLAITAGTGITAGIAASVADYIPADPDAELIAACERATSATKRSDALMDRFYDLATDDPELNRQSDAATDAARHIINADYHPSIQQAASLLAQTRAGLQAKARLLLHTLDEGDGDRALTISLACDVLAERA